MPEADIIIYLFYDCIAGKKAIGDINFIER